jgi:protein disulfide-isomerase A1
MKGDITTESLTKFVQGERFALFDEISTENFREYMQRGLPIVWVAVDGGDHEQLETVSNSVRDVAQDYKGSLSFVWVDNTKFAQHVGNLGIKSIPGIAVVQGSNNKYLFNGDVTDPKALQAWFKQYTDGEIERYLKSQEPPEDNDESVFVLVGKTFEDIVGKEKDVFVEFYAPWCGHCKKLAPEYEKVGEAFKDQPSVVIAKIDATENDTPEEIRGFPTLIYYPKGSKKGTKYEGGRTASDMIKWLKQRVVVSKEDL